MEIVVPVGVKARAVRDFVQRFTPWIDRKVAAMQCFAEPAASVPTRIDFAYTGEHFDVHWQQAPRRELILEAGRLSVRAPDTDQARQKLKDWLKQAAQERLTPPLLKLARDLNYSIERVAIRCQRTRWGSCSTRGTVSLNCSLVFLRPRGGALSVRPRAGALCRHMNHSPAFWRLVQTLEPDYRRLDRELLAGWRTVPLWVFGN